MVCVECGRWAYRYEWVSSNKQRRYGYADPDEIEMYWLMVCKPNCELNAVRHASFQLEEEAAASGSWNRQAVHVAQVQSLVRAAEELRKAWNRYYGRW